MEECDSKKKESVDVLFEHRYWKFAKKLLADNSELIISKIGAKFLCKLKVCDEGLATAIWSRVNSRECLHRPDDKMKGTFSEEEFETILSLMMNLRHFASIELARRNGMILISEDFILASIMTNIDSLGIDPKDLKVEKNLTNEIVKRHLVFPIGLN